MPPRSESKAAGFVDTGAAASRLNRNSIRIGWLFATNSYRCSPEPLHVALGFLLGGLADLIGDLGADLAIEQMLEREPGAGEIEENLIESALRVRLAGRCVLLNAAFPAEALGEHSVDQFARRDSPLSRGLLDSLQQLRR